MRRGPCPGKSTGTSPRRRCTRPRPLPAGSMPAASSPCSTFSSPGVLIQRGAQHRVGVDRQTAYRSWREGTLASLQVGQAGSSWSTPGQTVPDPPAGWPRCEHRATTNALSSTARRHGSPGGPAERACRQRGRSRSRLGPMGGVASPRGSLRPERCDHRARRPRQAGLFGTEQLKAALSAERCPAGVVDPCEGEDDLVGEMTEVLTSSCVALAGRRGARNRAESALRCARNDLGPMALRRDGAVARPGVRHQL